MRKKLRFDVRAVVVKSIDGSTLPTDQYRATVLEHAKVLWKSAGYNYATEARRAGLDWLSRHGS